MKFFTLIHTTFTKVMKKENKGKILLNFPCNGLSFISYILFEWNWLTRQHFIDIQDYLFDIFEREFEEILRNVSFLCSRE